MGPTTASSPPTLPWSPLGELTLGVGGGRQGLGQWHNNNNSNIDENAFSSLSLTANMPDIMVSNSNNDPI